jgi:hypothetical protein
MCCQLSVLEQWPPAALFDAMLSCTEGTGVRNVAADFFLLPFSGVWLLTSG